VNGFVDRIEAVTADQAAALAADRLVPANRAVLIYPNADAGAAAPDADGGRAR
jgi:hypothetical protein